MRNVFALNETIPLIHEPYSWTDDNGFHAITGKGSIIAIPDDGLDLSHPDFQGRILQKYDSYHDCYGPDANIVDTMHGTAVAGVAAGDGTNSSGKFKGVAPNASLLIAKLGPDERTLLARSIHWAVNDTIHSMPDVISISRAWEPAQVRLTADPAKVCSCSPDIPSDYLAVCNEIQNAIRKGVIVVAAAGNEGPGNIAFPACINGVIAVGASTKNDQLWVSSDTGPPPQGSIIKPDLVAPGVGICTAKSSLYVSQNPDTEMTCNNNNYVRLDGTSFSAPHAAGLVALLKEVESKCESLEFTCDFPLPSIKDALKQAVEILGETTPNNDEGYGRIDVAKAINYMGNPARCGHKTPDISITPSSQPGMVGASLTYNIEVKNNDPQVCGKESFSLNVDCPEKLTCNFKDTSLIVKAGGTNSTEIYVESDNSTVEGDILTFTISVNEGYVSNSASADYVVDYPSYCDVTHHTASAESLISNSGFEKASYLVQNPGFEDNTAWQLATYPPGYGNVSINNQYRHTGSRSLLLNCSNETCFYGAWQTINLPSDNIGPPSYSRWFIVTGWYKWAGPPCQTCTGLVSVFDVNSPHYAYNTITLNSNDTNWHNFTFAFDNVRQGLTTAMIGLAANGVVYFDDVNVVPAVSGEWYTYYDPYYLVIPPTSFFTTEAAHSGSWSFLSDRQVIDGGDGILLTVPYLSVQPSAPYQLNLWYKFKLPPTNSNHAGISKIFWYNSTKNYLSYSEWDFKDVDNNWHQFSTSITSPSNAAYAEVALDDQSQSYFPYRRPLYFDDASLTLLTRCNTTCGADAQCNNKRLGSTWVDSSINRLCDNLCKYNKCPGDINGDGKVDIMDSAKLALAWHSIPGKPKWNPSADINEDGIVDISDSTFLGLNWGKSC